MIKVNIITLSGYRGAGKTTVSDFLQQYRYKVLSFASTVKDIVHLTYGFDRIMLEGNTPQNRELRTTLKDSIWNQNSIQAMENTADMYKATYGDNVWAKILIRKIFELIDKKKSIKSKKVKYIDLVISDLRFQIEFDELHKMVNEVNQSKDKVHIKLDHYLIYKNDNELKLTDELKKKHHSYWEYLTFLNRENSKFIHNNKLKKNLYEKIVSYNDFIKNKYYQKNRPTFYFNKDPECPVRAAGILFYVKHQKISKESEKEYETEFLMFKRTDTEFYEDFGGKTDSVDKCCYDTAFRETEEETNHIITKKQLDAYLIRNKYLLDTYYIKDSKYIITFIELESKKDNFLSIDLTKTKIFGDTELKDNILRTVEWVKSSDLIQKNKEKKINIRLCNSLILNIIEQI